MATVIGNDDHVSRHLGQPIIRYPRVGSTMAIAGALARNGAPHGTVVWADEQTAGRGRLGRTWTTAPRSALLTSWILGYSHGWRDIGALSPLVALAVGRAIRYLAPDAPVAVKWPNDVLIDDRKAAGILLASRQSENGAVIIAGIGANLFPEAVPDEIYGASVAEWCPGISAVALLREIAGRLESVWQSFGRQGCINHGDLEDINNMMAWRDEQVTVQTNERMVEGTAMGIDADGSLMLQERCREIVRLRIGEIVRGPRLVGRVE